LFFDIAFFTIFVQKKLGRILALDYGQKRIGIAVTDPLNIIPNIIGTIETKDIWVFLDKYLNNEKIDTVVIGYPVQTNGKASSSLKYINPFIKKFIEKYPEIKIVQVDERFTTKMAQRVLIDGGFKKKERQNKARLDQISAAIILQWYLESIKINKI